jgi:type I site-specific restriction endonuclease
MTNIVERLREAIVVYDEWYQGRLKTSETLLERFSRERKEAAEEITRLRAAYEAMDKMLREANQHFMRVDMERNKLRTENEKLHREAAIRIDQITREQEAHLRTIADYNRAAVENEKLRAALKPFAAIDTLFCDSDEMEFELWLLVKADGTIDRPTIKVGDLRAAAAAIRESGDE